MRMSRHLGLWISGHWTSRHHHQRPILKSCVFALDLGCLPFTVEFASLWPQDLKYILVWLSQPLGSSLCYTGHRDTARLYLLYCSFLRLGAREFYNICCLLELCLKSMTQVSLLWGSPNSSEMSIMLPNLKHLAWGIDRSSQFQIPINLYFCCFSLTLLVPLPVPNIEGPVIK